MNKELTENVANNVAKREMQDLTEKWRNGTLKDGFYFVKENDEIFISICSKHCLLQVLNDCEVLAPVPTYEEWEELQESNDGLSKLMFKSLMNKFVKADEEREKLEEQLKKANSLLLGFLDESSCSFDHNGYCQEHSSTEPDYRCIQQQLKWYFKKYEVLK